MTPNKWNKLTINFNHPSDKTRKDKFFVNGQDFTICSFNKWVENSRTPKEITIHSIYEHEHVNRHYFYANYCNKYNRIEVHYLNGKKFTPVTLEIENHQGCKITNCNEEEITNCEDNNICNCENIVFVQYDNMPENLENYYKCKPLNLLQPGHSKGSIIVGLP